MALPALQKGLLRELLEEVDMSWKNYRGFSIEELGVKTEQSDAKQTDKPKRKDVNIEAPTMRVRLK